MSPFALNLLIAIAGSFIYNFILFMIAKDKCDKLDIPFDYQKYFRMNWDNWAATTLLAPFLVLYLDDIIALCNKMFTLDMKMYEVYYLGAGPITEVVIFGVSKLLGWKKTWVTPVHEVAEKKE